MRPERQFYFKLARALGYTVRDLLDKIDSRELSEWMAYDLIDPIGQERIDIAAAIIASTMVEIHRKPGSPPVSHTEFLPKFLENLERVLDMREPMDWQQMKERARLLNKAFGGTENGSDSRTGSEADPSR